MTLEAEATGQKPLSYQWQLIGANLPGANSPTLTIAAAQVSDSGEYTVVVTNALGLVNSTTIFELAKEMPVRYRTLLLGAEEKTATKAAKKTPAKKTAKSTAKKKK